MRRQYGTGLRAQRVVGGQRLGIVNVEGSAGDALFLEGGGERAGVNDGSAGSVDDGSAGLHEAELAGADKAAAAVRQHKMHGDVVGAAEQIVLLDALGADFGGAL